jgi:hypothetical protein
MNLSIAPDVMNASCSVVSTLARDCSSAGMGHCPNALSTDSSSHAELSVSKAPRVTKRGEIMIVSLNPVDESRISLMVPV